MLTDNPAQLARKARRVIPAARLAHKALKASPAMMETKAPKARPAR